jgi:hypothetical protein
VFVAVVLVALALALRRDWRLQSLIVAGVVGLVAMYVGIGYRAGWQTQFADPSRYAYPAVVLALLALVPAVRGRAALATAAIIAVALFVNIGYLGRAVSNWERSSQAFLSQVDTDLERIAPYGPSMRDWRAATDRWGRP